MKQEWVLIKPAHFADKDTPVIPCFYTAESTHSWHGDINKAVKFPSEESASAEHRRLSRDTYSFSARNDVCVFKLK